MLKARTKSAPTFTVISPETLLTLSTEERFYSALGILTQGLSAYARRASDITDPQVHATFGKNMHRLLDEALAQGLLLSTKGETAQ